MRRWLFLGLLLAAGFVAILIWTQRRVHDRTDNSTGASRAPGEPVQLETSRDAPQSDLPAPPPDPAQTPHGSHTIRLEPCTVHVVAKADGRPIEGAVVRRRPRFPSIIPSPVVDRTTDAGGNAEFDDCSDDHRWSVRKRGYRTRWLLRDDDRSSVALVAATPLRGRVVDASSGAALAGVRIRTEWIDDAHENVDGSWVDVDRVTDDDGRFEIAGVPAGKTFRVVAARDGYATVLRRLLDPPTDDALAMSLGEGARIHGTVTHDYETVAGAEVFVVEQGASTPLREPRWSADEIAFRRTRAITDASGHYVIRGVATPSTVVVYARTSDGAEGRSTPVDLLDPQSGAGVDVEVARTGSIVVSAVDATTNEPLDMNEMRTSLDTDWGSEREDQRATSDEDGKTARFASVPAGAHRVYVLPDEHLEPTPLPIEVEAGKEARVIARLERGRTVTGRLVNAAGEPVEAYVTFSATYKGAEHHTNARSGKDGRFTMHAVAPAAGELSAFEDDVGTSTWKDREIAGDLGDLVVSASAHIVGVMPEGMREDSLDTGVSRMWTSGIGLEDDGSFRIAQIPAGRPVTVFVRKKGHPAWVLRDVTLREGERRDIGTVVFPDPIPVQAQVLDAAGQPVAGALVRTAQWWNQERVRTSKDGRFRFALLPPGRSTLWIETAPLSIHFHDLDVTAGMGPQTIRLPKPGTCSVKLISSDGAPVAKVPLNLFPRLDTGAPDWERRIIVRTDSQGKLAVSLFPGLYGLLPHSASKLVLTSDEPRFEIRAGESIELELQVKTAP